MMKYNKIKISSHPRSGSHYLAQLIDVNFFDGSNYLRHYGGHSYGQCNHILQSKIGQIYLWRNAEDTLKSLFKMRHRFGLNENDFEIFKNKKISTMYDSNLKVNVHVNNIHSKKTIHVVDDFMNRTPTRDFTPIEFIQQHKQSWVNCKKKCPNLLIINYDELLHEFDITMQTISDFLGRGVTEFIQVNEKVGWTPK